MSDSFNRLVEHATEALRTRLGFDYYDGQDALDLSSEARDDARAVLEAAGVPALLAEIERLRAALADARPVSGPDPVLAAIAAHRDAEAAFDALPDHASLAETDNASEAESRTFGGLFSIVPTTLAGTAALFGYLGGSHGSEPRMAQAAVRWTGGGSMPSPAAWARLLSGALRAMAAHTAA